MIEKLIAIRADWNIGVLSTLGYGGIVQPHGRCRDEDGRKPGKA